MKSSTQGGIVAGLLGLGILLFSGSGCEEKIPPKPAHYIHVETSEIPAFDIADAKISEDDFQLVTLPDGHDYWIYLHKNNDRGYSGMAHSPECKRCRDTR